MYSIQERLTDKFDKTVNLKILANNLQNIDIVHRFSF